MRKIHIRDIPSKNEVKDGENFYLDSSWGLSSLEYNVPQFNTKEDLLVKELVNSDDFLRIYLKYYNPYKYFCSHVLFMTNDTNAFFLTDAALNLDPDPTTLVKIVENAVKFYRELHLDECKPTIHVNLLTNSGHLSLSNPTSCKMQLVKDYLVENYPDLYVTTWQLDACLYYKARQNKGIVGDCGLFMTPDIIVVPNLDTGNAIYKALLNEYKSYGFVIGGTIPAVLNSRSDLDKNEESIKILKDLKLVK